MQGRSQRLIPELSTRFGLIPADHPPLSPQRLGVQVPVLVRRMMDRTFFACREDDGPKFLRNPLCDIVFT